jgi:hypothetical protein
LTRDLPEKQQNGGRPPRARWLPFAALLLVGVGSCLTQLCTDDPARKPTGHAPPPASNRPLRDHFRPLDFPVIDVHVHLAPGGAPRLLQLMRERGFDRVVNLSGGHPLRGLPEQVAVSREHPDAIVTFAGLAYEQVRG